MGSWVGSHAWVVREFLSVLCVAGLLVGSWFLSVSVCGWVLREFVGVFGDVV